MRLQWWRRRRRRWQRWHRQTHRAVHTLDFYFVLVFSRILVVTFSFSMWWCCMLLPTETRPHQHKRKHMLAIRWLTLIQLNYIFFVFVWFIFAIIYETVQRYDLWNMDVLVQWTCHRFKLHHLQFANVTCHLICDADTNSSSSRTKSTTSKHTNVEISYTHLYSSCA